MSPRLLDRKRVERAHKCAKRYRLLRLQSGRGSKPTPAALSRRREGLAGKQPVANDA
jgi:hypothetical protein